MTSLLNPVLFSLKFSIPQKAFSNANLVDPILNCDTKLFVDPLLVSTSGNKLVRTKASALLVERFRQIVSLVAASKANGDKAWRTAAELLDLEERPETCLGYGGSGTSGSSRPAEIRQKVLSTAREIINLGESNPRIISLMGLFEEGVGPDTISDLTTNISLPVLCEITAEFCAKYKVPTKSFPKYGSRPLPENPFRAGRPIILVPGDIVRDLPLAADWSDVGRVIGEIKEIRDAFNRFLGPIAEATITDRKRALKKAAFQSLEHFRTLFKAITESSDHYDPNADTLNFYAFRKILTSSPEVFSGKIARPEHANKRELARVVREIIIHFRDMVENNNLWEMLWDGLRPKRERASQLLFFAVADMFCKANNIDISPETNMGGGPVDFKFSSGYRGRILVEIKLSKGQVVHGYEKQLEVYKRAAKPDAAFLMIMNVGGMGKKLVEITRMRGDMIAKGERASEIEVVDARRRPSASKA